ncbi:COG1361 S-layer family protein [Candidatus Woesearchaeota archaeon]|nr:COG1361 S-layer family protein [Candidatus Woesearchaeota archaeon]MCF8012892.1 COG1361 S-layer family protein [Candidatus Woesearchaeota archaeon]
MKKILTTIIMVLTIIALTQAVAAQTIIKSEVTSYTPSPAEAGDTIDIWVKVSNTGVEDANNIQINFLDNYPFKLVSETDRITNVKKLEQGGDYLIQYSVRVDPSAPQGTSYILIKTTKQDTYGYEAVERLPITIRTTDTPISVSSIKLEGKQLAPGESSTLKIGIKNLAKATTVRDLSVTLGLTPVYSATGLIADLPFVPINSGSQKTVDKIKPGQTAEFDFEIAAYPDAESKMYKLPIQVSYRDEIGTQYNKTIITGLEVNSQPELMVILDQIDINTEKLSGELILSVTNKGISDLKLMTITLKESQQYEIVSSTNQVYIGNVDSDDFETANFEIQVKEDDSSELLKDPSKAKETGTIKFPILVEYKDSLNKDYKQTYELEYTIRQPTVNNNSSGTTIAVIIIILIIVGVVVFRKKKKAKKKKN